MTLAAPHKKTSSVHRTDRQTGTDISERLSLHLAQADRYEHLWHRRVAWRLQRWHRERTLREQVRALRQRVRDLEAQNAELAAFDRTVAHELKNLLSRIIGYAEVLAEQETVARDQQLLRCLGAIARDGRKLCSIVDDLLVLCGASFEEPQIEPLDTGSIVSRALERLAPTITRYQAEVVLPDAWPVALGYAPWVEEVWVNYVSNACKYGGFLPRIELGADLHSSPPSERSVDADRVWVGAGGIEGGKTVRFWVRDSGPGLSPEQQARLFRPFARLHPARADGNGLGLSIVRQLVTKLGGQVGVESDGVPGQGSTFTFDLPKADG